MGVYINQSLNKWKFHLKQVKTSFETMNFSVNKPFVKYRLTKNKPHSDTSSFQFAIIFLIAKRLCMDTLYI